MAARPWVGMGAHSQDLNNVNGYAGDHKGPHPTSAPPPPLRIVDEDSKNWGGMWINQGGGSVGGWGCGLTRR